MTTKEKIPIIQDAPNIEVSPPVSQDAASAEVIAPESQVDQNIEVSSPNAQDIPSSEVIPQQLANHEKIEKPTIVHRARQVITNFRQKITSALPGRSERQIAEVTGEALADYAIATSEESASEEKKQEAEVAFVASETEAVDDELIGTAEDPVIDLVESGKTAEVIGGIQSIAESGDVEAAEKLARDLEAIEDREALMAGKSTASRHLIDAEDLSDPEIKKIKNNIEAWEKERQEWHSEELESAHTDALELSRKIGPPPRIIAMRGGCGSGKSFAVRQVYGERGIFDESGDVPGAVKPDFFKGRIKERELETPPPPGVKVTSEQTHLESTAMNAMFTERLVSDPEATLLIDKQLEAADDIISIIEMGNQSGKPVELLDHDVPVELSAFRVLKRPYGGVDPNIGFDGVSSGFRGIRQNRAALIEAAESEDIVESYSLRAFDPISRKQVVIATKVDGEIVVDEAHGDLYIDVSLQTDEDIELEIESAANAVITEEFIEGFVARNFDDSEGSEKYREEARRILSMYVGLGMTFKEALDSKAAGIESDSASPSFKSEEECRTELRDWKAKRLAQS